MSDFQIHATPNPTEFMVSVRVPDEKFNPKLLQANGKTLVRLLPYMDVSWTTVQGGRVGEYGDYVYSFCLDDGQDRTGYTWKRFYFVKPKTQEERDTPFETLWSTKMYPWPAVLLELWFERTEVGGANEYAYQRRRFRPSVTASSVIRIDHYLSEIPWSKQAISHMQPIPTEISGRQVIKRSNGDATMNLLVDFPKCLHPEVILTLPPNTVSGERIPNAGTQPPTYIGNVKQQVFPATNFTDWQPFVIQDIVQPVKGLYLREKITIWPPKRIEAQVA